VGDSVTIFGSGFDPAAGNNEVCFGLGQANVFNAETDLLLAEVPANASSGRVKVTVNLLEAYSPNPFTVGSGCTATKGDMNGDGSPTSADVVLHLNCTFLGTGNCDVCFSDMNCDGNLTSADVVIELNYVFLGTPPPC
jgi:hypothetical protein